MLIHFQKVSPRQKKKTSSCLHNLWNLLPPILGELKEELDKFMEDNMSISGFLAMMTIIRGTTRT